MNNFEWKIDLLKNNNKMGRSNFATHKKVEKNNKEIEVEFTKNDFDYKAQYGGDTRLDDHYVIKIGIERVINGKTDYIMISGWNANTEFNENISNTFEKWGDTISLIETANKFVNPLGISLKQKLMYRQVWKDADPQDFSVTMNLRSENNAYTDVYIPIRELQKCFTPTEDWKRDESDFMEAFTNIFAEKTRDDINEDNASDNEVETNTENKEEKKSAGSKMIDVAINTLHFIGQYSLVAPGQHLFKGSFIDEMQKNHNSYKIKFIKISNFITIRNVYPISINVDWNVVDKEYSYDTVNKKDVILPSNAKVTITFKSSSIWTDKDINTLQLHYNDVKTNDLQSVDLGVFLDKLRSYFKKN